MKECPACNGLVDPEEEAVGNYCCDKRESRVENARKGRSTQLEDGIVYHPPGSRIGFGFYLMNWAENWEEDRYNEVAI